jgi:hypothetical protein
VACGIERSRIPEDFEKHLFGRAVRDAYASRRVVYFGESLDSLKAKVGSRMRPRVDHASSVQVMSEVPSDLGQEEALSIEDRSAPPPAKDFVTGPVFGLIERPYASSVAVLSLLG